MTAEFCYLQKWYSLLSTDWEHCLLGNVFHWGPAYLRSSSTLSVVLPRHGSRLFCWDLLEEELVLFEEATTLHKSLERCNPSPWGFCSFKATQCSYKPIKKAKLTLIHNWMVLACCGYQLRFLVQRLYSKPKVDFEIMITFDSCWEILLKYFRHWRVFTSILT